MNARLVKLVSLLLTACLFAAGCASKKIGPGQLALRAIEVRPIDAPYDVAFRAATHALFALGLTVKHTEKAAGILSATQTKKRIGTKVGLILLLGVAGAGDAGALIDTSSTLDVTMFLSPAGDNQTRMRIGMAKDSKIITDQTLIDRIWVITQREALIESGENVPAELEEQAQKTLVSSPQAKESSKEEDRVINPPLR